MKGYGWLNRQAFRGYHVYSGGKAGGGTAAYEYGWPSGGTSEPNVAFQLLFDADPGVAAGYMYDEIQNVELRTIGTVAGDLYNVAASGSFSGLGPGIYYDPTSNFHHASTLQPIPNVSPGTGDFTLEVVFSLDMETQARRNLTYANYSSTGGIFVIGYPPGHNDPLLPADPDSIRLFIEADDGTRVTWDIDTSNYNLWSGQIHKLRWVVDRTAGLQYAYIDGIDYSGGGNDISSLAGKNVPINGWEYGYIGYYSGATFYETRFSHNKTNNSGGPNVTLSAVTAPSSLSATPSGTQVALSWTNNSGTAIQVWRSATNLSDEYTLVTTTSAGATGYTDTGLTAGDIHKYKIRAESGLNQSSFSSIVVTQVPWGTSFDYGYPLAGSVESDVLLQWGFEEASGNFVDEISSHSLTPVGTITHNVTNSSDWANLSPGVNVGSTTSYLANGTANSADLGTGAFVIEIVGALDTAERLNQYLLVTGGPAFGTSGVNFLPVSTEGNRAAFAIRATDGTQATYTFVTSLDTRDGQVHKWRIYGTIGGNINLAIDGNVEGATANSSAFAGKTIGSSTFLLGGWGNGTFGCPVTLFEYRQTVGNNTNNSGGPNGG